MRRADGGPDAGFSLEPLELQALCHSCRTAWDALGKPEISLAPSETANLRYRRSLYVVKDMKKGDVFTQETVRRIRPAYGLPPDAIDKVLGRKAKAALSRGTALTWEMIEDDALNPERMK
jgi:N-acetylneuraminate synthase